MIKKIILGCAVTAVVGYLGTVGYVYHYDQQRNPVVASNQIDTLLTRNGCDYCHSDSAKLPFYAELPIAKPHRWGLAIRLGQSTHRRCLMRPSICRSSGMVEQQIYRPRPVARR